MSYTPCLISYLYLTGSLKPSLSQADMHLLPREEAKLLLPLRSLSSEHQRHSALARTRALRDIPSRRARRSPRSSSRVTLRARRYLPTTTQSTRLTAISRRCFSRHLFLLAPRPAFGRCPRCQRYLIPVRCCSLTATASSLLRTALRPGSSIRLRARLNL